MGRVVLVSPGQTPRGAEHTAWSPLGKGRHSGNLLAADVTAEPCSGRAAAYRKPFGIFVEFTTDPFLRGPRLVAGGALGAGASAGSDARAAGLGAAVAGDCGGPAAGDAG
jgi:hypothetical protein